MACGWRRFRCWLRSSPAAGPVTSLYGTVASGSEALGAVGGGAVAAIAGIRATMLIGAIPIAATMSLLAWRHRS